MKTLPSTPRVARALVSTLTTLWWNRSSCAGDSTLSLPARRIGSTRYVLRSLANRLDDQLTHLEHIFICLSSQPEWAFGNILDLLHSCESTVDGWFGDLLEDHGFPGIDSLVSLSFFLIEIRPSN